MRKGKAVYIKEIMADKMEMVMSGKESVKMPFVANIDGKDEQMHATFYAGEQMLFFYDDLEKKLEPEVAKSIAYDFIENKAFKTEREEFTSYVRMQMQSKPNIQVVIESYEKREDGRISVDFQFSGVMVPDNKGTVLFEGLNFEYYSITRLTDSPYLGFQRDIFNKLRAKLFTEII